MKKVEKKKAWQGKGLLVTQVIFIAVFLLTGVFVGYRIPKEKNIQYISQAELLQLEKNRIANQGLRDKQLFFGKPKNAIELIEAFQKKQSTGKNIILITDSVIYGKKIKSISKEVHKVIINSLKE